MTAATRHGGSAGHPAGRFPPRSILLRWMLCCALLMLGALAQPAHADALYRCTGASGEAVYSSNTAGYRHCQRIGSYAAPRAAGTRAPRARRDRFGSVVSSVSTSADAITDAQRDRARAAALIRARARFADVQASVQTSAITLSGLPAARMRASAPGASGGWSYSDSTAAMASASTPEAGGGSRVLRGAVYRVKRADGSVEYTNIAPPRQRGHAVTMLFTYLATCMACDLHSPIHWNSVRLNLQDYASAIRQASIEYGVDEAFLRAIIHAESAFNPHALSLKGAQGLMQLMPGTASDMGVLDAFDAEQNIRGGARYLGGLLQAFHGNERLAAAAYNAGPGAVQRYSGVPPYAETRVYVERVEALRQRYGKAIHPPLTMRGGMASALQ
ncbi:lytic transglycosylase domain-containing protein [Dyella sp.]|uniref:lytic transglycosylase domain-containing protein n=1 Tax=Dyella sp. TaxID=1869338 RepID=UPI002D79C6CE|nr:lytic transglycosylase domain-containing protein [Dyella sp.]HET6432121.1 lytic transglycosylase domain-containing protein [Dyella sp.]